MSRNTGKTATKAAKPAAAAKSPSEPMQATGAVERDLAGGGMALPGSMRSRMEQAFGHSFADVRIHTGGGAAAATARHGAEALTVGRSIAFAPGAFQPGTTRGDFVLAHELAHVVQQAGRGPAAQARQSQLSTHSTSNEGAELEAEQAAARVVRGLPAGVRAGSFAGTTRQRIMRRATSLGSSLPVMTATPVPGGTSSPARTGPLPVLTTQVSPAGGRLAGLSNLAPPSPTELRDASPKGMRAAMAARAEAAAARTPTVDQAQTAQPDAARPPPSVMVAGASAGASDGAAAEPAAADKKGKGKDQKKARRDKQKEKDKAGDEQEKREADASARAGGGGGGGGGGARRRTRRFGQIEGDRGAAAAEHALQRLEHRAEAQTHHEPAGQRIDDARAAATPPPTELMSRSQGAQVSMVAAETPPPANPGAARTELSSAIEAAAPANMEEMSRFDQSPQAGAIRSRLQSNIQGQVGGIQTTIDQVNHPASPGATPAPVTQPPAEPAPATAAPRSTSAVPPPIPDTAVDASEFREDADSAFAEHEVSEEARENATEGPLHEMHQQEQDIDQAVDSAGERARTQEAGARTEATDELQSADADAHAAMGDTRERAQGRVGDQQDRTRSGDQTDRQSVTEQIEGIYATTATSVNTQLTRLTEQSTQRFDDDQGRFLEAFQKDTRDELERFKDDRYSTPVVGWGRWLKDRFVSINELEPVKQLYQRNRDAYIRNIDGLITRITADADATAAACRALIAAARVQIDVLVAAQPPRLRQEAEAARTRVQQQFSQLEQQIERTVQQVRSTLQERRARAIEAVDQALAEIQAENEALLDKLANFIKAIAEALGKFFKLMVKVSEIGIGDFLSAALDQAIDGVQNHLWDQLQVAFKEWLFEKLSFLQPLLMLPSNWLEVLTQAATNLLGTFMESIPEALPGIAVAAMTWLATTLAAKLIPGFGAIMAVIDGIRAAWGLIQRLIAGATAFFEFVLAVASRQPGGVAFARALAVGIVAMIDPLLRFLGVDRLIQRVGRAIVRPFGRIFGRLKARFEAWMRRRRERRGAGRGGRRDRRGRRDDRRRDENRDQERQRRNERRLERAVTAIRPQAQALLDGGASRLYLRARLALWRLRYRLSSLSIRGSEIEAVINPRRPVVPIDGISPEQIGAAIEPLLQRIEEQWLARQRDQRSESGHARVQAARHAAASGGRVQMPYLHRHEHLELFRDIEGGRLAIDPSNRGTMRAPAFLRGGNEQRGGTFLNDPTAMGSYFIPGAGKYESTIPAHVAGLGQGGEALRRLSPTRRLLTRVLEPARSEGMLPTTRVGEELVRAGRATPGEIIHGDLAPMAFVGATSGTPEADRTRQTRIGNVFQRLRMTLRTTEILQRPGGAALRRLAIAVERWLQAHFRPSTDPRTLATQEARLIAAFLAFLQTFHGDGT